MSRVSLLLLHFCLFFTHFQNRNCICQSNNSSTGYSFGQTSQTIPKINIFFVWKTMSKKRNKIYFRWCICVKIRCEAFLCNFALIKYAWLASIFFILSSLFLHSFLPNACTLILREFSFWLCFMIFSQFFFFSRVFLCCDHEDEKYERKAIRLNSVFR